MTSMVSALHREPQLPAGFVEPALARVPKRDREQRFHVEVAWTKRVANILISADTLELASVVIAPTGPQAAL